MFKCMNIELTSSKRSVSHFSYLKLIITIAIDNFKLKVENALSGKVIKRRRSMKKIIILKKLNNKRKKFEDIINHAD